jgi:multidrug efflux pump subunit AcrA (membrane-fusion protein)
MNTFKNIFKSKITIGVLIFLVLVVGIYFLFFHHKTTYQFIPVASGSITETVSLTGNTTASQSVSLGFSSSGNVSNIYSALGKKVSAGQILAELNTSDLLAQLHNAQAGLVIAQQQASTSENNLANVTAQQTTLVSNALNTLLNSTPTALSVGNYIGYDAPTVSGTYTCTQEGTYDLNTYSSSSGISVSYTGLEQGSFLLTSVPRPMGNCGLFLSFDKTKTLQAGAEFNVNIPNKNAPNYNANNDAYQLALQNKEQAINVSQAALDQANANLTALVTTARPEDIATAKGALEIAQAAYQNTIITAPSDGTIVSVAIAPGQIASPNAPAIEFISLTSSN